MLSLVEVPVYEERIMQHELGLGIFKIYSRETDDLLFSIGQGVAMKEQAGSSQVLVEAVHHICLQGVVELASIAGVVAPEYGKRRMAEQHDLAVAGLFAQHVEKSKVLVFENIPIRFHAHGEVDCLDGLIIVVACRVQLIEEFIATLKLETEDLGIEIRLNTPGTVDACKKIGACGVILAAGGEKIVPQVPGIDKAYTYDQILTKKVVLSNKKVAVIGGGLTGLETAEYLSDFNNEVTVVEMASDVGTAMYRSVTNAVVSHIQKNGGHILTNNIFKNIGDGTVTVNEIKTGYDVIYDFNAVVIAMGVKANTALVEEFEAAFDKVSCVGDTVNPGNIADATHSAYLPF